MIISRANRARASCIADDAGRSFDYLADYIWKTPNFLEMEEAVEQQKLNSYFPFNGDDAHDEQSRRLRGIRMALELPKLRKEFPGFMAKSNLVLSTSMFEYHCLVLCKLIEEQELLKIGGIKGNGIYGLFNYLRHFGISLEKSPFHRQVVAAIKIRNCLIHANGIVSMMKRDASEIARIVKTTEFISNYRLDGSSKNIEEDEKKMVRICDSSVGDQLVIDNKYAWISNAYFKRSFHNLVQQGLGEVDN